MEYALYEKMPIIKISSSYEGIGNKVELSDEQFEAFFWVFNSTCLGHEKTELTQEVHQLHSRQVINTLYSSQNLSYLIIFLNNVPTGLPVSDCRLDCRELS